jgi:agmatine deiminase
MQKKKVTPQFRMPAEFEKHEATILAWPHNPNDWPGKFSPINWVYTEIVKNIVRHERIRLIVKSADHEKRIKSMLNKAHVDISLIDFLQFDTDRSWMRDSSPSFVKDAKGNVKGVHFLFNGWAKYDNWKKDVFLPEFLTQSINKKLIAANYKNRHVVLEGGSIDVNGKGTLLTTEECLMDDKIQVRNPGFSKTDYAEVFKKYLGISNVIWLNKGITGDDTHGHVDDLCRFVNPNTLLIVKEDNPKDDNYYNLNENIEILQGIKLENGRKPEIITLPMPSAIWFDKMRLPASYANFYITNGSVLVPTFNDENDRKALGIISECFPTRKVIGIHAVDLVWGLGTLHCLAHEEPA